MAWRPFLLVCALVVLALELLALGHRPMAGPSTAELERIVAGRLQAGAAPVSNVRCVRPDADVATCVALMSDGVRTRVRVGVDTATGRVTHSLPRSSP